MINNALYGGNTERFVLRNVENGSIIKVGFARGEQYYGKYNCDCLGF